MPGYFGCANLCGAVRAGVANAVAESGLIPGKDFNVVLVSIDPTETPKQRRERLNATMRPRTLMRMSRAGTT